MPPSRVGKDKAQWEAISEWLENRLAMPLTRRDRLRPAEAEMPRRRQRSRPAVLISAAASVAVLAISLWTWSVVRSPIDTRIAAQSAGIGAETAALTGFVADESREKSAAGGAGEMLRDRWQLSGIAYQDGSSVIILRDRVEQTSRRISDDADLDGWMVRDLGRDYVLFAQNGEEVRLALNDTIEH
jgi:hypothetical protein